MLSAVRPIDAQQSGTISLFWYLFFLRAKNFLKFNCFKNFLLSHSSEEDKYHWFNAGSRENSWWDQEKTSIIPQFKHLCWVNKVVWKIFPSLTLPSLCWSQNTDVHREFSLIISSASVAIRLNIRCVFPIFLRELKHQPPGGGRNQLADDSLHSFPTVLFLSRSTEVTGMGYWQACDTELDEVLVWSDVAVPVFCFLPC